MGLGPIVGVVVGVALGVRIGVAVGGGVDVGGWEGAAVRVRDTYVEMEFREGSFEMRIHATSCRMNRTEQMDEIIEVRRFIFLIEVRLSSTFRNVDCCRSSIQ